MVPAVRQAVNRAGLPQQVAYLHLIVAAMEGQNGRYDEARRHCEAAESILQTGSPRLDELQLSWQVEQR